MGAGGERKSINRNLLRNCFENVDTNWHSGLLNLKEYNGFIFL